MPEQPMPKANNRERIIDRAHALLDSRSDIGIERYKEPLQPFNGRDFGRDCDEEVGDFVMYYLGYRIETEEKIARLERIQKAAARVAACGWGTSTDELSHFSRMGLMDELRAALAEPEPGGPNA